MIAILMNSLATGGAEKVGLTLLDEFEEQGIKGILLVLEKEKGYPSPKNHQVIYLTNFEKLHHPIVKAIWVLICAWRLRKIVRQYGITIVQSHLIRSNFVNVAAGLFGSSHKAQIINHRQLTFPEQFPIREVKKFYYRWLYKNAYESISISEVMKKDIDRDLHLKPGRINHRVIYNPHDIRQVADMAREETVDFSFSERKKYLISAGRLFPGKCVDVIIKALALVREKMPEVELIVLGDGVSRSDLEQLASDLNQRASVNFLGFKPNPFSYIARSDLFVMASQSEGLPNIIIESLACGMPVISSDCTSGPREILSPNSDIDIRLEDEVEYAGYGVLYPVGRVDLLADAILRLCSDDALRFNYCRASLARAKDFDKSVITPQYFEDLRPSSLKELPLKVG